MFSLYTPGIIISFPDVLGVTKTEYCAEIELKVILKYVNVYPLSFGSGSI